MRQFESVACQRNNEIRGNMMQNQKFAFALVMAISLALMAATALAQTQQPKAPTEKPNIVVIFGDDIGITDISAYSNGLLGFRTPNIDRLANEGLLFNRLLCRTKLYCRPVDFHHRAERGAHGAIQGRHARCPARFAGFDHYHGPGAQKSRVCHGPVRQEPPGGPGRDAADQSRLRRVLRQPLPPKRRRRAELPDYPKNPEFKKKYGPRGVIHSLPTAGLKTPAP